MKIRMHKGSYEESMATEQDIDPTKIAIFNYIKSQTILLELTSPDDIIVRFYAHTPDREWRDDFIILGLGLPYGFCSEDVFS